ncbi:hypothetical protein NDU88_005316 [Pleurodeles waltl]|uniref:Uncharacterized protein n=1 Tax=Pleurodeles waltl TaxID=8319 RepID=A0AAV7PII1_PLEWA|nr:hypothetical protein NDU88_005316 [Pleurodeles waltl]
MVVCIHSLASLSRQGADDTLSPRCCGDFATAQRQGADEVRSAAEGVAVPGGRVAFGERPLIHQKERSQRSRRNAGQELWCHERGAVTQGVRCCALQAPSGCTSWNTEEPKEPQPQRDCETESPLSPRLLYGSLRLMVHRGTWGT